MKHAGIHFPENAGGEHPNVETILGMPGISHGCTLICSPSARYWYRQTRGASPLVVWRAVPRQGKLPAQLGWDARKVAEECLNLWDEQPHGGTEWFTPLNELQFEKENGAPFPGYGPMAQNLARLRPALRQEFSKRGQQVMLMWPAWVPSDDMDHLLDWHHEAVNWNAIGLHCYGSAETMRTRYDSYRAAFPDHPIFVGEWNANHEGHDEQDALEMWAEIANTDPGFLGATYYIWETNNTGERDLSIWGNPGRYALFHSPPTVQPEEPVMPPLPRGIDVASYQGYPNWSEVREAGYDFAITKVTEDDGYVNPTFAYNWAGIKDAGMIRGAYHFARPQGNDAVEEADYFVDLVEQQGIETGDILALDLEAGAGDLGPWVLAFCHRVEERCGFSPIIYTGRWFSEPHNLGAYPEIGNYALWLASYQQQMPAPPAPWQVVSIWQHSSSGQVPGIAGDVDLNVFNGDLERLPLLGKPAATEPEEPENDYNVGPGILAKMAETGDQPATDEQYTSDQVSEAWGTSGAHYVYVASLNRTYRYDPAA